MIHHISIAVQEPLHVARVLAEIWQGSAFEFVPCPGSYIVVPFDQYGSAIEVYPLGTAIIPGDNQQQGQSFVQATSHEDFGAVHAAISVPTSQTDIEQIGAREGWRTLLCDRGPFQVIEFWVENRLMLEFLPAEIAAEYLKFTHDRQVVEQVFGAPVFATRSYAFSK
ncbi:MAG TPA: hypothetical protein V6C64_16945 [Microcoleaceae cyanobacterium]